MFRVSRLRFAALSCVLACSSAAQDPSTSEDGVHTASTNIEIQAVAGPSDPLFGSAIQAGRYRLHMIDVGTGLAILIQGKDFNVLFDAGSNDDVSDVTQTSSRNGNGNRVLAYLHHAVGPSGKAECRPEHVVDGSNGPPTDLPRLKLNHVFLSHPHQDHVSLLASVVRCYDVDEVWEPGVDYDSAGYVDFLQAVAEQDTVHYHTIVAPRTRSLHGETIKFEPHGDDKTWDTFDDGNFPTRDLGAGAHFRVVYTDGAGYGDDVNQNSLVVRFELGHTNVLLMGDAQAGTRLDPEDAAANDPHHQLAQTEGWLLDPANGKLSELEHVDIMQIGHHGSATSSRKAFMDKVAPKWALVGAGPKKYGTDPVTHDDIVLPDNSVIDFLRRLPSLQTDSGEAAHMPDEYVKRRRVPRTTRLFRTDARDTDNGTRCTSELIGANPTRSGGCDNFVLSFK
jgi:competence protein ComEC